MNQNIDTKILTQCLRIASPPPIEPDSLIVFQQPSLIHLSPPLSSAGLSLFAPKVVSSEYADDANEDGSEHDADDLTTTASEFLSDLDNFFFTTFNTGTSAESLMPSAVISPPVQNMEARLTQQQHMQQFFPSHQHNHLRFDPTGHNQAYYNSNTTTTANTVNITSFKCLFPNCGKEFSRKGNLTAHLKLHNPNRERSWVCSLCPRRFFRIHDLIRHDSVHSGSRPFKCTVCNKGFTRKDAIRRHALVSGCT